MPVEMAATPRSRTAPAVLLEKKESMRAASIASGPPAAIASSCQGETAYLGKSFESSWNLKRNDER